MYNEEVKNKYGIDGKQFTVVLNTNTYETDYILNYLKKDNGIYILTKCNFFQRNWRKFKLIIWKIKRKLIKKILKSGQRDN